MNLLKKITPDVIKAYGRKKMWMYSQLNEIKIIDSGISEEGYGYVTLPNKKTFFSYTSDAVQKKYYNHFINPSLKKVLHPDALNTLIDVSGRYYGPLNNNKKALSAGKFYNVNEGDIVIEAGAFVGIYAAKIGELVKESGKVYAIEAVPENFQILKKNIEENNITNVIPINIAIWNHQKKIKFYRTQNQIGSIQKDIINTENYIELPADTIDNIMAEKGVEKVDVARIQLNGVEPEALQGMTNLLKTHPKLMIAGMYSKNGTPVQEILIKELQAMGYNAEKVGESVYAEKV